MITHRQNFHHLDKQIKVAWSFVLLNSENYTIKCFMYLLLYWKNLWAGKKSVGSRKIPDQDCLSQKHLPREGAKMFGQVCTIWLFNNYNRMEGLPEDFVDCILHSFAHGHYTK